MMNLNNTDSIENLKTEINTLKEKLDGLLDVISTNSERALELSEELDSLIVQYYNSIRVHCLNTPSQACKIKL